MAGIFSERAWNKVWLYRTGLFEGPGHHRRNSRIWLDSVALALGILFGLMATSR